MRWPAALALCLLGLTGVPAAAGTLMEANSATLRAELDSLRGTVVLVNFWATWCGPCLEEIPTLKRLEAELGERGFKVLAVSLDDAATADTVVIPFMNKWFPDFDSLLNVEYEMDTLVSVVDQGWNEILPTSYLIDRDGSVAVRIQGINTEQQFRERIEPLLQK